MIVNQLRNDPQDYVEYLQVALDRYARDGDVGAFLVGLRVLVEAKGGVGWLARETRLKRSQLTQVLSSEGDPTLVLMNTILPVLDLKLCVIRFSVKRQ